MYTTTYVFTSLVTKFYLFSNFGTNIYNLRIV